MDFVAYIIRITAEYGDVVSEGDDVRTVVSKYGNDSVTASYDLDASPAGRPATAPLTLAMPNKLFLYGLAAEPEPNAGPSPAKGTFGTSCYALHKVRINDDGTITPVAHATVADATALGTRDTAPVGAPRRHLDRAPALLGRGHHEQMHTPWRRHQQHACFRDL